MLAERRKKVIYSNPRGLLWANDNQKFGKRMLQSMGWSEGKGLGKNEGGITENIKASFKFDNKGFGYKQKVNGWIEENNVYEKILSDLAQQHTSSANCSTAPSAACDLEQKAKLSSRIHYRKFIKAKNLSIKSEKDLFTIFPTAKKEIDVCSNESQGSSKVNAEDVNSTAPQLTTVESKLSIEEYFKQKMKNKLCNSFQTDTKHDFCKQEQRNLQINETSVQNVPFKNKKRKLKH